MTKRLMVAGCSFSAPSRTLPGTSWSEIMAKRLGWDLTNLARQGCSNGGIRIQIEEIRRQQPDFAVVSGTFWDRMEIPARAAPYVAPENENKGWASDLQLHLQNRNLKNGYKREDGINNINYGNNNYNMICETIFSLAENTDHPYRSGKIDKHSQQGVRTYIDTIYDNEWKKQQDEWIIREGVMMMYLDGIKFLFLPNLLWPFDQHNQTQWRDALPDLIPDYYLQLDPMKTPQVACGTNRCDPNNDPGYHGNGQSQELIADWHLEYMKNGFDLY
jgi:hypothetical protein